LVYEEQRIPRERGHHLVNTYSKKFRRTNII
jgi:hypothetical protein